RREDRRRRDGAARPESARDARSGSRAGRGVLRGERRRRAPDAVDRAAERGEVVAARAAPLDVREERGVASRALVESGLGENDREVVAAHVACPSSSTLSFARAWWKFALMVPSVVPSATAASA